MAWLCNHKSYGITLIELMIAVALGTLVITLALRSQLVSHQTQLSLTRTVYHSQDAYHALYQLAESAQKAGYFGCARWPLSKAWSEGNQSLQFHYGVDTFPVTAFSLQEGHLATIEWVGTALTASATTFILTSCKQSFPLQAGYQTVYRAQDTHHTFSWPPQLGPAIRQPDGQWLHLPSLEVVIPLQRTFFLRDRALWYQDQRAGQHFPAILLLERVHSLTWRYVVEVCSPRHLKTVTHANQLSEQDWQHIIRAEVQLTLLVDEKASAASDTFTKIIAMQPVHRCEDNS